MVTHMSQPTRTSCGPTCVAMLAGSTPRIVISLLRSVRTRRKASHATNVAEVARLLAAFGLGMDRRQAYDADLARAWRGLLKVHRRTPSGRASKGWHWVVLADGYVFDPAKPDSVEADAWGAAHNSLVHYYEVE